MSTLLQIFIVASRDSAMMSVPEIEAVTDAGLKGGRYTFPEKGRRPSSRVTLIEYEISMHTRAAPALARNPMNPAAIWSPGINLNVLRGNSFASVKS